MLKGGPNMTTFNRPAEVLNHWQNLCEADPTRWSELGASYAMNIAGDDGGKWMLRCEEKPAVVCGESSGADCEVRISSADFLGLARGELNPQSLFGSGRLKVAGDLGAALKLGLFLQKLTSTDKAEEF